MEKRPMKYRALLLTVASGVFHSNFVSTSAEAQAGNTPTAVKGKENAAKGRYSQILDGPNLTRKAVPFRFTGKGAAEIAGDGDCLYGQGVKQAIDWRDCDNLEVAGDDNRSQC
jgi:hypothetical protein